VVDDHAPLAAMARMALEWAGYHVEVAHHGWLALARAERFRPDVVVCDLHLPDIDGTEVARRLRASAAGRPLVLIACSGDVPDDPAATVLAAGFDAFLDKPVDIRRLLATIESARGARRAAPD
jgi:CheY-like chemotaxis protein